MAKYILYVYAGRYTGKVVGVDRNITSARKMAYELIKNFKEYKGIDILDASITSDTRKMRIIASIHYIPTIGKVAYASHTTDKINQLTPNGAVVSFAWNEKDHVYPD